MLGAPERTVRYWCETGKLSAIPRPFGKKISYRISPLTIQMFLETEREELAGLVPKAHPTEHRSFLEPWKSAMILGLMTGRAFSSRTVDDYWHYVSNYFNKQDTLSLEGLKSGLASIAPAQIAKRQHFYKALVCLGKYLISEGALDSDFPAMAKPLFPKRHLPPRRHCVSEEQLASLWSHCRDNQDRLILCLLSSTGLRALEACSLKWEDVDLDKGILTVKLAKGGKTRRVGMNAQLIEILKEWRGKSPKALKSNPIFLNRLGKQMNTSGLYQRLVRIGEDAGIRVSPHALRRAFVTSNANKGRPLQMLQKACGHSDIKTTMSYCRTSEDEVIAAMKGWD